jgi:hypothetical protein
MVQSFYLNFENRNRSRAKELEKEVLTDVKMNDMLDLIYEFAKDGHNKM